MTEDARPRASPPTSWLLRLSNVPILQFYRYMWQTDRQLLLSTLLVSYVLPLLLEGAPWFASRRKLSRQLRQDRTHLQHQILQPSAPLSLTAAMRFALLSVWFAALQTGEQLLRNRVELRTQLLVKRLLVERILYSELGALERSCVDAFGVDLSSRPDQLDQRVFADITQTLHLFNTILPNVVRGTWTFGLSACDLYRQRARIDPLAVLRPTIVGGFGEVVNLVRARAITDRQALELERQEAALSRTVGNMLEGLHEIQANSMQAQQLALLDALARDQLSTRQGLASFLERVQRAVSNRGVFDFLAEIFSVQLIMRRRGIDHEAYAKVQTEIDYVTKLFRRTYLQAKTGVEILDSQHRVMAFLNLPNFRGEYEAPWAQLSIEDITVRRVRHCYRPDLPPALDMTATGHRDLPIRFQRGRVYALVGHNRAGKSTLLQILCRLLIPQDSDITINGRPLESIPRNQLRAAISYVSQRPFIFPGTVAENITLGASLEASVVEAAAEAAGVFSFGSLAAPHAPLPANQAQLRPRILGSGGLSPAKPWEGTGLQSAARALRVLRSAAEGLLRAAGWNRQGQGKGAGRDGAADADGRGEEGEGRLLPQGRQRALLPSVPPPVPECAAGPTLPADVRSEGVERGDAVRAQSQDQGQAKSEGGAGLDKAAVLVSYCETRGSNLSGGFAQSVALARVFARKRASVIILDESLGQMDTIKKRDIILPRLFAFVRQHGMTLIIVSHEVSTVGPLVDEVVVMEEGKVVQLGSHRTLQHTPPYANLCATLAVEQT